MISRMLDPKMKTGTNTAITPKPISVQRTRSDSCSSGCPSVHTATASTAITSSDAAVVGVFVYMLVRTTF